jgi:hypothetical protein
MTRKIISELVLDKYLKENSYPARVNIMGLERLYIKMLVTLTNPKIVSPLERKNRITIY